MNIEVIHEPVPIIIVRNIFSKKENKAILKEALDNEKKFKDSSTAAGKVPDFRNNKVAYYDAIYQEDRSKSPLLSALDKIFINEEFMELLNSSPYPINKFSNSNYHETQVSRYGDDGQFYQYHVDAFNNNRRQLTMVYYMNESPKTYVDGQIIFTKSPIISGKPVDESQKELMIEFLQ